MGSEMCIRDRVYTPASRSSMERTSSELPRGPYDLGRRGSDLQSATTNPYAPVSMASSLPKNTYQPTAPITPDASPYMPSSESQPPIPIPQQSSNVGYPGYQPFGGDHGSEDVGVTAENDTGFNSGYQPSYGSYEPPSMNNFEPPADHTDASGGYEPPSFQPSSFEPPSYEPGPMDDDKLEDKPKKKNFMDDDDDDIPGLRPKEKSKAEKDRENEEMFKKVAEEEGECNCQHTKRHANGVQQNEPRKRKPRKRVVGASGGGLVVVRKSLRKYQISLLKPSWVKPAASCTTPILNAG